LSIAEDFLKRKNFERLLCLFLKKKNNGLDKKDGVIV